MISKLSLFGSPYVGVYISANDRLAIVPIAVSPEVKNEIARVMKVEVHETMLGGSPLIGSLSVMNSNGAVITDFASEDEVKFLFADMNVLLIDDKINAVGNDILVNDNAALVHTDFDKKTVKMVEDVLGVEVTRGEIGGIKTIGSAAVVTNKGMIVHPDTGENEVEFLKSLFKVPVYLTTANYGSKYVGAGVVANTHGAVVGNNSTTVEIDRIENGLDLIS